MRLLKVVLLLALVVPGSTAAGPVPWNELELTDLEGRRWTAEDFEGRHVLIDFWATWCTPCLAEIPVLQEARQRFSESDLVILGVSVDLSERREVLAFLRRQGVEWPQFYDGLGLAGTTARLFGVEVVPFSVLLDEGGRVVATDLRGEVLLAALAGLLAETAQE